MAVEVVDLAEAEEDLEVFLELLADSLAAVAVVVVLLLF